MMADVPSLSQFPEDELVRDIVERTGDSGKDLHALLAEEVRCLRPHASGNHHIHAVVGEKPREDSRLVAGVEDILLFQYLAVFDAVESVSLTAAKVL